MMNPLVPLEPNGTEQSGSSGIFLFRDSLPENQVPDVHDQSPNQKWFTGRQASSTIPANQQFHR